MKSDSLRNISRWKAWVAFTGFMAFSPIALMAETSVESISAVQQHQVINGVVVDASGEAIIGANVIVEGTSIGTITDFDGHFSLSVPKGKKIKISFIGYKDQVVTRFSSNKYRKSFWKTTLRCWVKWKSLLMVLKRKCLLRGLFLL